ncbi:barstar family protein [Methylorubrum sp. Q1]|uniref:barstar family protein n=1 Tax=Methylorubrum sp. Q1 TaxID=2562453 RepID=UPI00187D31E8|nr:barstar family protein [Methylorubrum sp. Q1]
MVENDGNESLYFVPSKLKDEESLYKFFLSTGLLPDYFGFNWDALLDSLRDLSWVKTKSVTLIHSDIPFLNDKEICNIYLDILQTAVMDWRMPENTTLLYLPPGSTYVNHDFSVVFPQNCESVVSEILDE